MKEKSIWENITLPNFPKLTTDIDTNILIIGGGIAGILCAYELKKRNINSIIIEKNKIGFGKTKNTTAFITAQHETLYQTLIESWGINTAKQYLDLNLDAVNEYKKLSEIYDIDFVECDSIIYSSNNELINKEKKALTKLDYEYKDAEIEPLKSKKINGISFPNQATINPLKLIKELSIKLNIYEHTKVLKLTKNTAYTENNKIKFNKVVIATNYPFIDISGFYFTKMYQKRSYVCSIKNITISNTYCNLDDSGYYYRSYNNDLIIGGNDRKTNQENTSFKLKINNLFPNAKINYYWSNQDCITLDGIPYIGKYDRFHESWYIITGFNLWGFTWAMAGSKIISDLIENKKIKPITDPQRTMNKRQLLINLKNSLNNLINLRTPRCTHLKCALIWNDIDKTYECPCHGSRYDEFGKVIDGPANKNIKI